MKAESFEDLGNRMKLYEMAEAGRRLMPGLPVLARLDGRAFHTFTRGLEKPYDVSFMRLMQETTKFLVSETHAGIGYVQSDEITLFWIPERVPFDGRIQKLESVLASMAGAFFNKELPNHLPQKAHLLPHFDCRVWAVPSLQEVFDTFKWRELDASKNSLTMLAHAYFSTKELHGKRGRDKHEMLYTKGVNWNDEPDDFKRGSYWKRVKVLRELSPEELSRIPEAHRPEGPVTRSEIIRVQFPPISKIDKDSFLQILMAWSEL